ncbi:unnamed protein product [Cylicocyclus nassatus]|uniref:DUF3106 domain-containing protein n=1 Tax=Cylicocyclus nassatus TaxID=53992 RepID=A0AA36DS29_CYLNA|nr:unnamed protein product [Cylicocyclus nassatus]
MKVLLSFTLVILTCVNAQTITNKAMRTLFKYADTNATDKLTTALNKDNTTAERIKRVTTWIETNLVKKGATVPKGAVEGDKAATLKRVKAFLNQRESLRKLVNQVNDPVRTVVPTATVNEMKKLFWKIDQEKNNDLSLTDPEFHKKVLGLIPKDKQKAVMNKVKSATETFQKKNPTDAKNLLWDF